MLKDEDGSSEEEERPSEVASYFSNRQKLAWLNL